MPRPGRTPRLAPLGLAALIASLLVAACASPDGAPPAAPGGASGPAPSDPTAPADPVEPPPPADPPAPVDPPPTPPAPPPPPAPDPDPEPPPAKPAMIYGVTVDDPWRAAETSDAIAALPRQVLTRVVFDEGMAAAEYVGPVRTIAAAGPIMGELLDSFFMPGITVAGYRARAREYLAALGDHVAVWEIGNEINGEWLGATSDVVLKLTAAHEEVRAAGRRSALTLYYNEDCWARPENEMFRWVEANLDPALRGELDHVWVSFYEDDCNGIRPDWTAVFRRLGELFPSSTLGFGECGTAYADRKVEYLNRWYGTVPDAPRFVGGYFWWYFSDDMVPRTKPLWAELERILADAPP